MVEDEDAIAEVLDYNLRQSGFQVHIQHRGDEALESIRAQPPDLLILDMRMPKIDGLEVCRRLRQDKTISQGIKILAITGYSEAYDRDMVLESGADEYLIKSMDIDNLVENSNEYKPSEILDIQIKRFHESIQDAISNKMRRLVIIHGVGQGTLRMQIINELKNKYPEYLFQDASFKEYGFGATLVHLHTIRK